MLDATPKEDAIPKMNFEDYKDVQTYDDI